MTPRPRRHALRAAALLAGLTALLWPSTAAAHPWGEPPAAVVGADGDRVVVEWAAQPDDALLIGIELGLVDPERLDWAWDGPRVAQETRELPLVPPAASLERYMLERVRVFQNGARCDARVEPFGDFVTEGATTVHRCPQPVRVVELEITLLHDLHEAYRTFAESSGDARPRQAVFTVGAPRHTWSFGDIAADEGAGSAWGSWTQTTLAAGAAAAVAGLAAQRRRRRRGRPAGAAERPRAGTAADRTPASMHGIAAVGLLAATPGFGWLEGEFVRLIDSEPAGLVLGAVALLTAFGIGAAHALAPGHGKALIAAYLVGTRGRAADALALGSIVAVMHCGSVLVLGGLLFATVSLQTDMGRVMSWLTVAAGGLITAVGAGLVTRQARLRAQHRAAVAAGAVRVQGHDHDGDGHEHPGDVQLLSRRGVVALGTSGGLLPSPSAFLVLGTAVLIGRGAFGLLLVAAFSVGLASTLTAVGLAAIRGRTVIERRALANPRLRRVVALLPLASSLVVLLGGLWVTTLAVLRL